MVRVKEELYPQMQILYHQNCLTGKMQPKQDRKKILNTFRGSRVRNGGGGGGLGAKTKD